jgi:hypothetical protein
MFHGLTQRWLLCVAGMLALATVSFAAEPFAGRWEGSIRIPGNELPLIVDLSPGVSGGGGWAGSIVIPGMDIKGFPLNDVVIKGADATFALKSATGLGLEATFKAHLNENGSLTGNFEQGGNTAPFQLNRAGTPQVELPPRSTRVAKEFEGEWHGEYEMLGYSRKVTLKLTNNAAGEGAAELVIVGKRVNNLPVDRVVQEGNLLTVLSHETGITFEGRRFAENGEVRGVVSQGPMEAPLTLRRN